MFKNFVESYVNLLIFLPYFFSVPTLFKTLLSPWKNMYTKKTVRGYNLAEWASRKSFNTISRILGMFMRLSLILFYFLTQLLLILALPMVLILYLIFLPILSLMKRINKNGDRKKEEERVKFIGLHLLNQENYKAVELWFEQYYKEKIEHSRWWTLKNLFAIPPLARDWSYGYTPTLDEYCLDMTSHSYQSNIKNVQDRHSEIGQIEMVLTKEEDHDALIVGEVGVGKHTIADALAKRIYEGQGNAHLVYRRVLKLNMEKILTHFNDEKQREYFFEQLLSEAEEANNVIILIDNIDKYLTNTGGRIDLTEVIEKFAKSKKLKMLGITTPFAFEKFINQNEKIQKYFTKVDVAEIAKDGALIIIQDIALRFEKIYDMTIAYESLVDVIDKSNFFITSIPFPEKAIELLDNACSHATQNLLDRLHKTKYILTPDVIDLVLTEKTHIPTTLSSSLKNKLTNLNEILSGKIISQTEALAEISSVIRRSFILIGKRKKPLASFLLLGPTGVGKTATAKTLASVFFDNEDHMQRFDMSLYQSKEDIPKLIGSTETGNPGLMASKIRENPYGVLLLDEIEKANPELLNIFLTILDEGYFTDGFGKRVDCKNLIIVATSNSGSVLLTQQNPTQKDFINYLVQNQNFSPEFLNRFDGVILYKSLNSRSAQDIARKLTDKIAADIYSLHKIKINVSDETLKNLAEKNYDPQFGARDMERLIRAEIEDKVAKIVLENKVKENEEVII